MDLDVRKVARLARLELSEAELSKLEGQIGRILGHIDQLRQLDTSDLKPFISPGRSRNVTREDKERPSLTPEKSLGNAPAPTDDSFTVPRVLEE